MFAVSRFRAGDEFQPAGQAVVEFFSAQPGCRFAELVRSLDDDQLWAIISCWDEVGSYRRSFHGVEAKLLLTSVLGQAIDEPSAYLSPEDRGVNIPRGEA